MEIAKNTTKITKKHLAGFQNLEILKKSWLIAICAVILIILSFSIVNGSIVLRSIPFLVIGSAVWPFYVILLKIMFIVQNKKFKNTTLDYTFNDQKILIVGNSENAHEETEMFYNNLAKVKQTKKYIYLYLDKNSALIVDKKGFTSGSSEKVMELLNLKFNKKKEKLSWWTIFLK